MDHSARIDLAIKKAEAVSIAVTKYQVELQELITENERRIKDMCEKLQQAEEAKAKTEAELEESRSTLRQLEEQRKDGQQKAFVRSLVRTLVERRDDCDPHLCDHGGCDMCIYH